MLFPYHTERISLPMLSLPVGMALIGLVSGNVLGLVLLGSGLGILLWALLQVLRQGRGVRLYADYLLIQGSVTGRVRRVPYADVLGFALTRRGSLALLYCKPLTTPQTTLPAEALVGIAATEQPLRRHFVLTARLAQPELLRAALAERLPSALSAPESYVIGLARRRRLRDGLIFVLALLATPLYILIFSRVLNSLR
jgi:hypothetical protein